MTKSSATDRGQTVFQFIGDERESEFTLECRSRHRLYTFSAFSSGFPRLLASYAQWDDTLVCVCAMMRA
jgi:hypothetical protein